MRINSVQSAQSFKGLYMFYDPRLDSRHPNFKPKKAQEFKDYLQQSQLGIIAIGTNYNKFYTEKDASFQQILSQAGLIENQDYGFRRGKLGDFISGRD